MNFIDAHIHLDAYNPEQSGKIVNQMGGYGVESVIAVSMRLDSCRQTRALHLAHPAKVKPAYGYHPEQAVPTPAELAELLRWIREHREEAVAIGEVGLPYYNRTDAEASGKSFLLDPYIELLETFILLAVELNKPIVLHAVYEDAKIACDLLEKHGVERAHFHWFKGDMQTVDRMIRNGYFISFTPDVLYEQEIQELVQRVPMAQLMAETDGPWPFEGPFAGEMTHPRMLLSSAAKLAELKKMEMHQAADALLRNTRRFFCL